MFDSFFGNSYIKIKYGETIYVRESVENIRQANEVILIHISLLLF